MKKMLVVGASLLILAAFFGVMAMNAHVWLTEDDGYG